MGKALIPEIAIVFTSVPVLIAAIALIVDRRQRKRDSEKASAR